MMAPTTRPPISAQMARLSTLLLLHERPPQIRPEQHVRRRPCGDIGNADESENDSVPDKAGNKRHKRPPTEAKVIPFGTEQRTFEELSLPPTLQGTGFAIQGELFDLHWISPKN
jgi:hypothetical protein